MEDRITELETKVTFQDQIIEDLNQRVIEQQEQIDILTASCKKLAEQMGSKDGLNLKDISQEIPPPHY